MDSLEGVTEEDKLAVAKTLAARKSHRAQDAQKSTHVFHHDKNLKSIPKIKNGREAVHAYFHNNQITKIENLEEMYNLTHLHLQWNRITAIQGLKTLCNLRKLFLGNNRIELVEGLEGLRSLEELHLEKQVAGPDPLCLDPRSLTEIGPTLRLLDVSGTRLDSVAWVKPLANLQELIARNNNLEDFQDVADTLSTLLRLVRADFAGNPMCRRHRYKETLVARCANLRVLDGNMISYASQTFLREFDKAVRLKQLNSRNKHPMTQEGIDEFFELNMIEEPKTKKSHTLRPSSANAKGLERAIDSTYSMGPRRPPPLRSRLGLADQPAAPAPPALPLHLFTPVSSAGELPDSAHPVRKGILKKPMPFKYL